MTLENKTLLISGASRGIGKAIALRAARDGANIAVVAKTVDPHPKLEGTIYTAVDEINEAGGKGLACPTDIRFEEQVEETVDGRLVAHAPQGIDGLRAHRRRDTVDLHALRA